MSTGFYIEKERTMSHGTENPGGSKVDRILYGIGSVIAIIIFRLDDFRSKLVLCVALTILAVIAVARIFLQMRS
jgi:hypothetical protein